ncbi:MAG: Glu/Leu/Phe/Val dehydrogenase, partial [Acidobacteria bacterium]|nr:Glu/Leu/Phe/Val dehydrogenase [Acidobacteriota bacterium]
LESWIVERLRHAEREITVNLPLIRDDGSAETLTGYRVQHYTARGPTLGPLRLCPDATLADTRARAITTTLQLALLDAPFGGSAGAIVCDPCRLTERELRQIARGYACGLRGLIGAHTDVAVEDEDVGPQILAWILDASSHMCGHLEPATVIGKPRALFGLEGHLAAVAQGVAIVAERVAADSKLARPRVAIQNLADYGHLLARCCDQRGMQVVALADNSGGTYSPEGLAVSSLSDWLYEHGMVMGYPDAEAVSNSDVLECECDLLIAAARNPISGSVAEHIRASVIVEAAYGALTSSAVEVLESHGVVVVPYVLAAAGAMAHACLEWTVNTSAHVLLTGEAEEHLSRRMKHAYGAASETASRYGVSLREGAYVAAIELIGDALRLH